MLVASLSRENATPKKSAGFVMSTIAQKTKENQATFTFQGDLVQVKVKTPYPSLPDHQGGKRQAITEFSPVSRKNLLDLFARLDFQTQKATFITLTFKDSPTAAYAKRCLRTFLKRVFRRFGDISIVWRMEYQKRGAIHFHLIAFDIPFYHWKLCLADWQKAAGDAKITNVKLEFCYNPKQVRRYVSKYIAKVGQSNLDTPSNLAVDAFLGRFWGIENRKNLRFAVLVTFVCEASEVFWTFKRYARRYWQGVNKRGACGFTLYVDNIANWQGLLMSLCG